MFRVMYNGGEPSGRRKIVYYIQELLRDPVATLTVILLALPGRMLALSMHEAAHAYVADRCGDPTARNLGRLTLNPLKHIDILYIVGFGWAKPVPINPRNYKGDYRKCDLKVSLAGITMNLILFLGGALVLYGVMGFALARLPQVSETALNLFGTDARAFITTADGMRSVFIDRGDGYYTYWYIHELLTYAPYAGEFVKMLWGNVPYYLFEMLSYFVQINIVLAIFNLIPIPPLDGYHVLNDLVLKRNLFASGQAMRVGYVVLIVLLVSGVLDRALSFVVEGAFSILGSGAGAILGALGVL